MKKRLETYLMILVSINNQQQRPQELQFLFNTNNFQTYLPEAFSEPGGVVSFSVTSMGQIELFKNGCRGERAIWPRIKFF